MSAAHTMTAVFTAAPPVTHMITVASSNPNSGVAITSSTLDNNTQAGGTTMFTRIFNQNATATYVAPATAGGNNFQKWQRDGSDLTTSTTASVMLDTDHTITAVYGGGAPLISVSSPNGSTIWTAGNTYPVTWTVSGSASQISYYLLDYSLDDGASWWNSPSFYASYSATSGYWPVPSNIASTQARVRLRAINSSGGQITTGSSVNFTISTPGQNPVANPTADNHAPQSGQSVNFKGTGSTDPTPGCSINSYSWNFGDGYTSTSANPSHAFLSPAGSSQYYLVSLQVSDTCGRNGTSSFYIYVTGQALGNNPQQSFSKDPVNLATGNYTYNHSDLHISGRGLPFDFKRFYNSKVPASANQPLGFGWTHSYNIFLSINSSNSAVIAYGDGHQETYAPNGAGGYLSEPGIYNVLTTSSGTYTLTTKEQQQYHFNSPGQLTSIVDKNNNTIALAYTGNNLTTITDTVGRAISFAYNANNCLTNITDPLGRTVRFTYDANTNLTGVTNLRGNLTQFGYDSFHQMTNAIDPRGNTFVSMQYDLQKRVVLSQQDALNYTNAFSYDFVNGITVVTDANGNMSTNHYDKFLRVTEIDDNLGKSQFFFYDTNNNRLQVIDKNGRSTAYSYDGNGNVISKTDPFLNTTAISYDAKNNPTNRLDAQNGQTLFSYDPKGNLTNTFNCLGKTNTYQYDAFGEPVVVTDANGNSSTNTYDSFGNLIKTQDALGDTNAFTYDIVSRKLKQVDALGRTNLFIYDNADNLTASVNALGKTNYFSFDGNNNRVTATDFLGNTATNIYDQKDRLIIMRDPLGGSVTNDYDALDRKIRIWDAMGGVTRYGYDSVGNLLAITNALGYVTRYAYDANGNRTNVVDALGNSTTNLFDSLNRLVSTQDALGHTISSVYDPLGRRIQNIDALNRTNFFSYDVMGRLTNFTDTAGGTVVNAYDNVGNRLFSTDPNGHTTTNVFDALNRLWKTTDPAGGVAQFGYDAVGNVISRQDPNGNTTTYLYDANNRRTKITYPTGTPVTFGYDDNGNRISMTDALGTTTYSCDALNRLTSVTDCFGKTVSYGYDKNGNRKSITYPGGKTVTYGYDAMNRLKTVTDWLYNTTTYNYDADGNLTNSVNPNGSSAVYQYDPANRLMSLTNAVNSAIISSYQYTLDAVGNHSQVSQTEQLPTIPVVGQSTYAYDNDSKQITLDGQTQGFDANGNMTSVNPTNLLAYDYENRLVQTSFTDATNTYQYDGAGNRMSASRSGVVTRYVLDRNSPLAQVLAETDSSGNVIYYYIYGLGLVSQIDAGSNAQYYQYDSRGSTIAMTDASGKITEAYAYDPFGRPINASVSDNHFRYLGRHGVMDEENGLLYIRARYYSTKRGRFITKDPTTGKDGDSQSMNRYIYALNNPVRLIDISGLSAQEGSSASTSSTTSDLSHQHLVASSGNTDLAYSILQSAVKSGQEEAVERAIEKYLQSHSGSIAGWAGMSATSISHAIETGVPIGGLAYDILQYYVDDRANFPNRGGLEEGARLSIDLSALASITAAGAAIGTVIEPGGGTLVGGAIGFVGGVAYDVTRNTSQGFLYNGVNAYVNTVPSFIENTYMNRINATGNFFGGLLYNAAPSWFP
jgi:RHS repeat-associated protein